MFEQDGQHLAGLILEPDLQAMLAQFARTKIQFEYPKTDRAAALMLF
jgi:hypothetical protein